MQHNTLSLVPTLPQQDIRARRDALWAFRLDHLQARGPRRPVTLPGLRGR